MSAMHVREELARKSRIIATGVLHPLHSADPDLLLPLGYANLASADTYMVNPEYYTAGASGQDDQFYVTLDPKTSTVGSVTVKITYIQQKFTKLDKYI